MQMQTRFGIPSSNYVGVMLRARLYQKRGQGQSDQNGARHPAISNACTNQIWIPTSNNVGDMLRTHTYTHAHAHTHTHTHKGQGHSDKNGARHPQSQDACTNQIWIPTSNNIGDMFRTRILYK